jgi:hypothetical protein
MDTSTSASTATADTHEDGSESRVLCAYSPRWLSGPTPAYRGLCPTWSGDELTAEHPAITTN